jgi:geranylgeranyl pyrophosphate synthase
LKKSDTFQKYLKEDTDYFISKITTYLHHFEKKYILDYKQNSLEFKNIQDHFLEIMKSSLLSSGKKIRPLFCYWILRCFSNHAQNTELNIEKVTQVAISIEILHNASLMIDDVQDESTERRNKPCIHIVHGIPNSINTASIMYFLAINHLPHDIQFLASRALIDCHIGQCLDLNTSEQAFQKLFVESNIEDRILYYENCVFLKTTRLIKLSLECLQNILNINESNFLFIEKIITKYGLIYQIYDDLKNLISELSGNKVHEDLKSGFRSFICIEFLNILDENEKKLALDEFLNKNFYHHMIEHFKFKQAIQNAMLFVENLSQECFFLIQNNTHIDAVLKDYIIEIFESPFSQVKAIILEKFFKNS